VTAPGSTWPAVKAAFVDRWETLADLGQVSVGYCEPLTALEVNSENGMREAVWWDPQAVPEGADPTELGVPVRVDETLQCAVWVQVLSVDSDDERRAIEQRCAELVGVIVDDIGANPGLPVVDGWADIVVRTNGVAWLGEPLDGSATAAKVRARVGVLIEGSRC
jgi:hypothetical protein